jgi:hypothetical protein
MDTWITGVYMRELVNQAEAASLASEAFNSSLQSSEAGGIGRAFAAVQSLLAAGAMVSKMLWPTPSKLRVDGSALDEREEEQRQNTLARGRTLRSELAIKRCPPLETRKVRNALEHFDDRLDRYFEDGHRMVVDRNIGPKGQMVVIGGTPALHLRLIDPAAGTMSVLEEELHLQELVDAIADVSKRASRWLLDHRQ